MTIIYLTTSMNSYNSRSTWATLSMVHEVPDKGCAALSSTRVAGEVVDWQSTSFRVTFEGEFILHCDFCT